MVPHQRMCGQLECKQGVLSGSPGEFRDIHPGSDIARQQNTVRGCGGGDEQKGTI